MKVFHHEENGVNKKREIIKEIFLRILTSGGIWNKINLEIINLEIINIIIKIALYKGIYKLLHFKIYGYMLAIIRIRKFLIYKNSYRINKYTYSPANQIISSKQLGLRGNVRI